MSAVKRYDPVGYDGLSAMMQSDPLGEWVDADDYDALAAECKALRKDNKFWRERSAQQEEDALNRGMDAGVMAAAHRELQAEVARLRGDAELLDWLVGQDQCVVQEGSNGFWLKWIDEYDTSKSEFQKGEFPTARAAINAAMTQEPRNE